MWMFRFSKPIRNLLYSLIFIAVADVFIMGLLFSYIYIYKNEALFDQSPDTTNSHVPYKSLRNYSWIPTSKDLPLYINNHVKTLTNYPPTPSLHFSSFSSIKCGGVLHKIKTISEIKKFLFKKHSDFPLRILPISNLRDKWQKLKQPKKKFPKNSTLAIIIPVRNRCNQLVYTIPYLQYFLQNHPSYRIYVIEHSENDIKPFNKAAIMNIGVILSSLEAEKSFSSIDYFIFHDVDTLPISESNSYSFFPYVVHRAGWRNTERKNDRFTFTLSTEFYYGGIVQFPRSVFSNVNGFGNGYWNWGLEDEDLARRWFFYYFENKKELRRMYGMFEKIVRVPSRDGRVWCYEKSSENPQKNKNGEEMKRKYVKMNIEVLDSFYCIKDPSKARLRELRRKIMESNGIWQIKEKFEVVNKQIENEFSFYSVKLLVDIEETRSWSLDVIYDGKKVRDLMKKKFYSFFEFFKKFFK